MPLSFGRYLRDAYLEDVPLDDRGTHSSCAVITKTAQILLAIGALGCYTNRKPVGGYVCIAKCTAILYDLLALAFMATAFCAYINAVAARKADYPNSGA